MEYENDNEYSHYNYRPSDEIILDILSSIEKEVLHEHLQKKDSIEGPLKVKYHTGPNVKMQSYSLYCGNVLLGDMKYGYVPVSLNVQCNDLTEAVNCLRVYNDFKGALFFKAVFIPSHFSN